MRVQTEQRMIMRGGEVEQEHNFIEAVHNGINESKAKVPAVIKSLNVGCLRSIADIMMDTTAIWPLSQKLHTFLMRKV